MLWWWKSKPDPEPEHVDVDPVEPPEQMWVVEITFPDGTVGVVVGPRPFDEAEADYFDLMRHRAERKDWVFRTCAGGRRMIAAPVLVDICLRPATQSDT